MSFKVSNRNLSKLLCGASVISTTFKSDKIIWFTPGKNSCHSELSTKMHAKVSLQIIKVLISYVFYGTQLWFELEVP